MKLTMDKQLQQKIGELMPQQQNEVAQLKQNLANTQQNLSQASQKAQAWDNLIHWVIANNNIEGELKASQQQLSEENKRLTVEYQRLNSEYQSEKNQLSHQLKTVDKTSQNITPEIIEKLSSARFMSVIFGVLFTISLFSIIGLVYFGTFSSSEVDQLNQKITELNKDKENSRKETDKKLNALNTELTSLKSERNRYKGEIEKLCAKPSKENNDLCVEIKR